MSNMKLLETEDAVVACLTQYVWQHVHPRTVDIDAANNDCTGMVNQIVAAIISANAGLPGYIVSEVGKASTKKQKSTSNSWCKRLRLLACAYQDGLYDELDLAGIYLNAPNARIDCTVVAQNGDRIALACRKARIYAKERKKHLNGFNYFASAA